MKKLILLTIVSLTPLAIMAQEDDDMYFVPTKENVAKEAMAYGMPRDTYYAGSKRSVEDYNRRAWSSVVPVDSAGNDIIEFSAVRGVYPDSAAAQGSEDDYKYTRRMSRFDDYSPSEAYWDGYRDGRWSSPWSYRSYYGWYDPWYWNDPWYYSSWYGWGSPWYYGYYHPWRYSWYSGPYYYGVYYRGGSRFHASHHNTGGSRTYHSGGSSRYGSGTFGSSSRTTGSNSGNFGGSRNSGNSNFGSSRSSGSFGGSRNSGSSFGGSRSGGGSFGGSRNSGGSFGGRR